jgi:anti-sigma factor RsiW
MKEDRISFETLVAYADGGLDPDQRGRIEAYLAAVPEAARHVADLRDVLQTMRADDSEPPTAGAVRRALAAWHARGDVTILGWLQEAERIVARLVFDGRARLVVPGFRGGPSSYQLAYECDSGRVDLRILPRRKPDDTWRIRGQVAVTGTATPVAVALTIAGDQSALATASADEFGRFALHCPPGLYDLLIRLNEARQVLVAPGLRVGEEGGGPDEDRRDNGTLRR